MWFIVIKYAEGPEMVAKIFTTYKAAEDHMKKIAKLDGPSYAIAHSGQWHRKTSNPSWEVTEV